MFLQVALHPAVLVDHNHEIGGCVPNGAFDRTSLPNDRRSCE